MAIKVNITDPTPEPIEQPANETVNIKIVDPNRQMLEFKLNMRRALNGDLMILIMLILISLLCLNQIRLLPLLKI